MQETFVRVLRALPGSTSPLDVEIEPGTRVVLVERDGERFQMKVTARPGEGAAVVRGRALR